MKISVNVFQALLALIVIFFPALTLFAQLPQNHLYQIELRNYLDGLIEEDFDIEIEPLVYDEFFFESGDDLYRAFIIRENRGRNYPSFDGLARNARYFTLSEIERDGSVYMDVGRNRFFDPIETAWWAGWDYEGNPYYNQRAVKLRAAVGAIVDMMMLEQYHEGGRGRRSDFAGANLLRYGYTYNIVKDVLPESTRAAYEEGMERLFSRIEDWGPTLIHADMDQFAVAGVWAVAESMDSETMRLRARAYVERVYNGAYREAGYIHHGQGFDPSYQGITFFFGSWAAMISGDPFLIEKVEEMSRLKAHLSFPEPDGKWFGPSHFATSNDAGSPNDQWGPYHRDIGISMITDEAAYLIWSGTERQDWYTTGVPSTSNLHSLVRSGIRNMSDGIVESGSSSRSPLTWRENHWTNGSMFAAEYYKEGTYDRLRNYQENNSELTKAPVNRSENYSNQFGDEFLIAKRDSFAVALHSGPLSNWGSETNISGLGGGGISAFWTPKTGSVLLGVQKGFQNSNTGPDKWEDWEIWPVHVISGETTAGKPFSTGRQREPQAIFQMDLDPILEVNGALNDQYAAPENALVGEVSYKRIFTVTSQEVEVQSGIVTDGTDEIGKLYEVIPVFIGDRQNADVSIWAKGQNFNWREVSVNELQNVRELRIDRFEGSVYINFNRPQVIRLSSEEWATQYQTRSRARNILVDLISNRENQEDGTITYEISYSMHGGMGNGSNNGAIILDGPELRQNYPNPFNPETVIEFYLPESTFVDLSIYDITGKMVRNLVNSNYQDGTHNVIFDANSLSSGVYFYKLKTRDKVLSRMMTFIK